MGDTTPNMTDYEAVRRSFRLEVPQFFNYARDVVDTWARVAPDKTALVAVGPAGENLRRYSFADLSAASNRSANAMKGIGIRSGDRVLIVLPRIPSWYEALLGCFKIGVVPMPGTPLLTPRDFAYRINKAEARAVITDHAGAAKVQEVRSDCASLEFCIAVGDAPEGWLSFESLLSAASATAPSGEPTRPDAPLLIYFTSGTVAYPKMVLHTHASYGIGHEVTARFWQDLKPWDLHWTLSDTGWAKAAWGKLFGQWRIGAAVFLWDVRGKPDLELMLRLIQEQRVTTFCAPPTVYRSLVLLDLDRYDWSGLRHCTSAGEPLNPEVIRIWFERTGLHIYDGYGQTETVNLVANYRCMEVRPGSMGKVTPGFDVEVVDEDGNVLESDEEGHVAVRVVPERPVGLFAEYWRDPEAMAASFRGDWYYTGDRARKDADGYFWFVARDDDVIISAAYRIGPFEVESALVEHPAVAEAAVVGKADAARGEIVKAFVVLAPGYVPSQTLAQELQEHAKRVTAPYKYPREVEFLSELPKTVSGKIRRAALREAEQRRSENDRRKGDSPQDGTPHVHVERATEE